MSLYQPAADYLPHESPMVLLDEVCQIEAERAVCRVSVVDGSVLAPFIDPQGALPGWFALELMAQTVGVWSGWHGKQNGAEPRLGMLLSARAFKCLLPSFPAGSELYIQVSLILKDDKLGSFECEIYCAERLVATARLNTYQPDDRELKDLLQES